MNKRIYPLDTTLRAIDSPNLNGDVFPQGHTIGEIKNWTPGPGPVPGIHQVVFTPEDFLPRVGVMRRVPTEPLKPYDLDRPSPKAIVPPTPVVSWTEWAMNRLWRWSVLVAAGMAEMDKAVNGVLWALEDGHGGPLHWPEKLPDARDVRHAWDTILAAVHAKPDVVTMGDPAVLSKAFDGFLRKHEFPNAGQVVEKPEETPQVASRATQLVFSPLTVEKACLLWEVPNEGIPKREVRQMGSIASRTIRIASGTRDPVGFIQQVLDDGEVTNQALLDAFRLMNTRARTEIAAGSSSDLDRQWAQDMAIRVGKAEIWLLDAMRESHVLSHQRDLMEADPNRVPAKADSWAWKNSAMSEAYLRICTSFGMVDETGISEDGAKWFLHRMFPVETLKFIAPHFKDSAVWGAAFRPYLPGETGIMPPYRTSLESRRAHGIALELATGRITEDQARNYWLDQKWEPRWDNIIPRSAEHDEKFVRAWFRVINSRRPGKDTHEHIPQDVLEWVTPEVYARRKENLEGLAASLPLVPSTFSLRTAKVMAFRIAQGKATRESLHEYWTRGTHSICGSDEQEMVAHPNPYDKKFAKEFVLLAELISPHSKFLLSDLDFIPEAVLKQARYETSAYVGGEPSDAHVAVSAVARYRAGAAILGDGLGVADDWESRTVRGYEGQEKGLNNPAFKTPIFAWWWISLATAMTDREEFLAPIVEVCGPDAALDGFRIFLERTSKDFTAGTATARAMINVVVKHADKIRDEIEDLSYVPRWRVKSEELPPIDKFEDPSTWLGSMWDDEVGEENTTARDILAILLPPLPHQTSRNAAQVVASVQQGSVSLVDGVMWWGKLQDIQGWGLIPPREERGVQFALTWLDIASMAPHMASLQHYILNWVNHWDVKEARILRKCGITSERAYKRRLPDKTEHSESFRNLVWDLCRDGRTLEQAVAAFKSKEVVTNIPQIPTGVHEWIQTALDLAEATGDDRAYDYIRLTYRDDVIIKVVHEGFQRLRRNDDKIEAEVTEILGDGTPNERNSQPMTTEITPEQAENGVGQATLVQGLAEGKLNIPTVLKAWEDKAMGVAFTTGARFQNAAGPAMTMVRRWLELACYIEDATSRYRFVAPMRDWTGGVVPGMDAVLKDGAMTGRPTSGPSMGSELALCAQMMVNGTWDMAFASGRMESVQRGLNAPTKPENRIIFTRDVAINWMRLSLIQGNGLGLDLLEKWASRNVIREALMTLLPTIAPRGYDWETSGPAGMWLAKEQKIRAEENAVMDVAWNVRNITAAEIVLMVHLGELESSHAVNKWNHGKPWTMGMNRRVENVLAHTTKKDGSRVPLPATVLRLWLQIASNTPNPKVFTADILTYTTPERLAEALDGLVQEEVVWAKPVALLNLLPKSVLDLLPARMVHAAIKAESRDPEQAPRPVAETLEEALAELDAAPKESTAKEASRRNISMATVTLLKLGENKHNDDWSRFREQWAARSANQTTQTREAMGTLAHTTRIDLARKAVIFAASTRIPVRFMEGPIEDEVFLLDELVQGVRLATEDVPLPAEALNHLIRRTNYAVTVGSLNGVSQALALTVQGVDGAVPSVTNAKYVQAWCGVAVSQGLGLQVPHLRMLTIDDAAILRGTQDFFENLLPTATLRHCATRAVESRDPWAMALFAPWIGQETRETVNLAANLALMVALGNMTLENAIHHWTMPGHPPERSKKLASEPYDNTLYNEEFLKAWKAIVAAPRYGSSLKVPVEAALRFVHPDVFCPLVKATEDPVSKVNLDESFVSHKGNLYLKREPTEAPKAPKPAAWKEDEFDALLDEVLGVTKAEETPRVMKVKVTPEEAEAFHRDVDGVVSAPLVLNLTAEDKAELNRSIQDAIIKGRYPNVSMGCRVESSVRIPNVDLKVKSETIHTEKKELNATWDVPESVAMKAQAVLDAVNEEVSEKSSPELRDVADRLKKVLTPFVSPERKVFLDDPVFFSVSMVREGGEPMAPMTETAKDLEAFHGGGETPLYKALLNLDPEATRRAHQTAAGMVKLVQKGSWSVKEAVEFWVSKYPGGLHSVAVYLPPQDPEHFGEGFVQAWVRVAEAMESAMNPTDPVLYTVFKQGLDVWADPAAVRKVFGGISPDEQVDRAVMSAALGSLGDVDPESVAMGYDIHRELDREILEELLNASETAPTKTLGQKALDTLREDAKAIALRTGVRRVREAASARLGAWWARHGSPQQVGESAEEYSRRMEAMAAGSNAFLGTSGGEAALSMLLGFVWTVVGEEVTDDNVRGFGDAVARELRVSGGTDLVGGFMDEVVGPMVSSMKQVATAQVGTGVRVFAGSLEVGGETLEFRQNQEAPDRRKA